MINQELPPKYYLDYFNYLLNFVQDKYLTLLNIKEKQFIASFNKLKEDEQCLYIRFVNRKAWFFKTEKIEYQEINNIPESLNKLIKLKFLEKVKFSSHKNNLSPILKILTKSEILSSLPDLPKSLKKSDLVNIIITTKKNNKELKALLESKNLIKVNFEKEVTFLKFLFFGNRYMDMTEFVVRDLGLINYYPHHEDHLVARFNNRQEAEDKWFIADQYEIFRELEDISIINNWILNVIDQSKDISEIAIPGLEKLIIKVGRFFERNKENKLAISLYKHVKSVPARERTVRCFFKLKDFEAAKLICKEMILNPFNADESIFATDFMARLEGKRIKRTTALLNKSDSIEINSIFKHQVELGAINYFVENNYGAVFSENHTWRAIFGLIFWDIIFDPELVTFHHPFQRRPSDLNLPNFYAKRKDIIIEHLNSFEDLESLLIFMGNNFEENYGIANVFVLWLEEIWDTITIMVRKIGFEKIKLIMHKISENIVENSRGFPDLFIWNETSYELIEIKSPTDTLSNQQLFWLTFFEENEVNSKVLRVVFNS